jgi:hypothetical protein
MIVVHNVGLGFNVGPWSSHCRWEVDWKWTLVHTQFFRLLQQMEPKAKIIPPDVHVLESNNKPAMSQIIPSTSLNPTSTSMRNGTLPNKDTHVQKRSHCYLITSLTMNFHNSIPLGAIISPEEHLN